MSHGVELEGAKRYVVSPNYRLGVLGFVRDQDGKPSNNGLLDILEALR